MSRAFIIVRIDHMYAYHAVTKVIGQQVLDLQISRLTETAKNPIS